MCFFENVSTVVEWTQTIFWNWMNPRRAPENWVNPKTPMNGNDSLRTRFCVIFSFKNSMKYKTLRLRKEIRTFFEKWADSQYVILTNVHFGSTQFLGAHLGSIQFFDLSLGSTQLFDTSLGSIQLFDPSVGSIQFQKMAWVHSTTVEPHFLLNVLPLCLVEILWWWCSERTLFSKFSISIFY